jgi:hypothetical protein
VPAALSSSGLRRRIERILRTSTPPPGRWSTATITALVAVCLAAVVLSGWEIAGVAVSRPAAAPVPAQDATVLLPLDQRATKPSAPVSGRLIMQQPVVAPARAPRDDADGAPPSAGRDAPASQDGRADQSMPELPPAARVEAAALVPVASGQQAPIAISVPSDLFTTDREESGGVPSTTSSPWRSAADAGVAVGRGSQKAAVKTAGFFARFGRAVAGSF